MNLLLGDGSCPRVPGAGGGLGRPSGSVCGGSPGGAGEGGVPQRPAGRPVPQFGQQRRRVAAAPQLRSVTVNSFSMFLPFASHFTPSFPFFSSFFHLLHSLLTSVFLFFPLVLPSIFYFFPYFQSFNFPSFLLYFLPSLSFFLLNISFLTFFNFLSFRLSLLPFIFLSHLRCRLLLCLSKPSQSSTNS